MSGMAAAGRDPRVERMIKDPAGYFAAARREAKREAEAATRRERELEKRKNKR